MIYLMLTYKLTNYETRYIRLIHYFFKYILVIYQSRFDYIYLKLHNFFLKIINKLQHIKKCLYPKQLLSIKITLNVMYCARPNLVKPIIPNLN